MNRCRVAIVAAASVLLASVASAQAQPARPAQPAAAAPQQGRGGIRIMTLTATAFADGGAIPDRHAQAGRDVSPALSWTGAPDSTASFVLIVRDADAVSGNGLDDMLHWMVWNIPGTATSLPEGLQQGGQVTLGATGAPGAGNVRQISASGPYYRGPAAPSTGPAHHYLFELYALDVPVNVQPTGMSPAQTRAAVMAAMASHIRGKGVLVGLYRRPAP